MGNLRMSAFGTSMRDRMYASKMSIIEQIYDAAFDRERFGKLLQTLADATGGQAAFLAWQDFERNCGFNVQFGNDPYYLQRYGEHYSEHDVQRPFLLDMEEGEPQCVAPFFDLPHVRQSIFYQEFIAPQNIVDNLAVNLIKRSGMIATLAILRTGDVPCFDRRQEDLLRELVPHLTRAVLIQSRLIDGDKAADGFRQSSAGARDHIMLLGDGAVIVEIDPQLSAIVRLSVGQIIDRTSFGKAIREAITTGAPTLAEIEHEDGSTSRLLCEAQLLTRDRLGDLSTNKAATHAIHIGLVDRPRLIAYDAIARAYELTPTEARVLEAAVEHGDLPAIGEKLGMARATARTHLHRIYSKTETKGFADLCRLGYRFVRARGALA